jgi:UDP-GlcNAc:undecaprenyl-phosphate GlcNAc-1-phosphate transferase
MRFILISLTSLLICSLSIPAIITVAFQKRLFDVPDAGRKVHKRIVPNFGGVAIFTAFLFSCALFIPSAMLPQANILMAAAIILFMTGLKDDVVGLDPMIKFVAQFACAFITAILADLRITNLEGVFGVYEMPYYLSVLFTVIFIVGIVNAFNLIDGIDGLSGSLGIVFSIIFAILFYNAGQTGWACMALALTGALTGFLFYNVTPAKIFMGDCGSLMLGFVASILSIKFLDISNGSPIMLGPFKVTLGICLVIAILIIPIFDTLRVFTLRILNNSSPFVADNNHLHHRLLFIGLSHIQATLVLSFFNILFVIIALSLQDLNAPTLLIIIFGSALLVNGIFSLYVERYKRNLFVRGKNPNDLKISYSPKQPGPISRGFQKSVLKDISKN